MTSLAMQPLMEVAGGAGDLISQVVDMGRHF